MMLFLILSMQMVGVKMLRDGLVYLGEENVDGRLQTLAAAAAAISRAYTSDCLVIPVLRTTGGLLEGDDTLR